MRKLLNTLYLTNADYYLACEGENIIIKLEGKTLRRFPIHILEGVVCFNYMGASPGVIRLCNENDISLTFLSPQGRLMGKFIGLTNGNVLLRREQYRWADNSSSFKVAKLMIEAKIINSRKIMMRLMRDHKNTIDTHKVQETIDYLAQAALNAKQALSKDSLRGIEGDAARWYFQAFDELIRQQKDDFKFVMRTRRPPMNRVNAMLSFVYSLLTYEMQAALETVGLDSYVGMLHTDRPGRPSLALDMIEELRSYFADRFVVSLINTRQISKKDFEIKENGAVLLNESGREVILTQWQKQKHREITSYYTKETIPLGLIPYLHAQLLARHIRGDIPYYPPFLI